MTPDGITRLAHISACGRWRYSLNRIWDPSKTILPFIMLNPSTADHLKDDPTILNCMKFARRDGHGGILVVNLFALRSSTPDALREVLPEIAVGPHNDETLSGVFRVARHYEVSPVAAWGNGGGFLDRDRQVCNLAAENNVFLFQLGVTQGGFPKHPLARGKHRIPADQEILPYNGREMEGWQ